MREFRTQLQHDIAYTFIFSVIAFFISLCVPLIPVVGIGGAMLIAVVLGFIIGWLLAPAWCRAVLGLSVFTGFLIALRLTQETWDSVGWKIYMLAGILFLSAIIGVIRRGPAFKREK